jgi:acetyl esterase/lipase
MVADVAAAVEWAHAHAAAHGGDPRRLHLVGHSAGAHLAALVAVRRGTNLAARGVRLASVTGLAGPYCIGSHFRHEARRGVEFISAMGRVMGGAAEWAEWSPADLVARGLAADAHAALPPFFLLHGALDATVPAESSLRFLDALRAAGARASAAVLPQLGHADLVTRVMTRDPLLMAILAGDILGLAPPAAGVQWIR